MQQHPESTSSTAPMQEDADDSQGDRSVRGDGPGCAVQDPFDLDISVIESDGGCGNSSIPSGF
ncbi:hypothetical protein [Streptomyces sp. NPDC058045]|uniref:hypothetical protein n=1 Tax=Streptomyces sp. NPDC058045 TaxID=3346311 RepID=UPI0036EAD095